MSPSVPRPRLRIEIAPGAWPTIALLPSVVFRRLRQQLDLLTTESLAELTAGRSEGAEPCPLTVSFEGLTARCNFDPAEHLVTLVRVDQELVAGED